MLQTIENYHNERNNMFMVLIVVCKYNYEDVVFNVRIVLGF